jgi:hypothetical protein
MLTAMLFAAGIATTIATGGGGSGSQPPPPPPPPPPAMLAITADNALDVSTVLVVGIGMSFDIGEITGTDVGGAAAASPRLLKLMRVADLPSKPFPNGSAKLESCFLDGTVDVTGTFADPNTLTVGDRIIAVFTDCDDGDGFVISGTVDLTVSAVQGNIMTEVFLLGFDVLLTDVEIVEGTSVILVEGEFAMTLDSLAFPVISQRIAGTELSLAVGAESINFSGLDHFIEVDLGLMPEEILATVSGRMGGDLIGGFVDYETTVGIQAVGDNEPYTGEILVTGAANSSVRIVINDSTSVTLEVDTNGDNVVDQFIDTNWAELNGNTSTINASTAPVIAREVIHAVTGFGSVAITPGSQFVSMAPFGLIKLQAVSGDFGPTDVNCAAAGTAAVSGTIASAGTFSAGDLLTAAFTSCARAGEVLDGSLDVAIATYDELPGDAYLLTATVTETGLARNAGGNTYTGDGVIDVSHDYRYTSQGFTYLNATATSFTVGQGGVDRLLSGASVYGEIMASAPPVTIVRSSSGSVSSPAIDGDYVYQSVTPDTFVFDADPATGPVSGALQVTASDGSILTIVAIDDLNVRLEVDYDGNGFADTMIDTTWAALQ